MHLHELLHQHDDNPIIYAELPAWRISDVLVHVAFWEVEGCKSLVAHAQHTAYTTPQFSEARVDYINAEVFAQLGQIPVDAQIHYATACREAFVRAVALLDDTALATPMQCPWNQTASVATFLQNMYEHERDHLNDVLSVLKVSS